MAVKQRRAEEDDQNASHCQSWKKQMIKRFNDDDFTCKMDQNNLKDLAARQKALRAAMLKTRFADTILKATQTLFPNNKSDDLPRKIKKEKELKKLREREKKALEEIERRAVVDDTATTLKTWFGATGYPTPQALQRLGLYFINHQEEEEDDDDYAS